MIKGLYHSAAGMLARQRHLEVVANNLANSGTIGFKPENVSFEQALNSTLAESRPVTTGEKFVDVESHSSRINRQGTITVTGNPLDLALEGEGYFVVETPTGLAYTRDGRFRLNAEGELVNLQGQRVLTESGTAQFPPGDVRIDRDGNIVYRGAKDDQDKALDRLQVVTFADLNQLVHAGQGLYVTQQEPLDLSEFKLVTGALEESTVNAVTEMVKMIEINQLYDASARAIQTQDATLSKAVNEVGKL